MDNMRLILLIAGIGIVLAIFLLSWLPGKVRASSQRRRPRPAVRRERLAPAGDALDVDGLVEDELEKLGQMVADDPTASGIEIRAGSRSAARPATAPAPRADKVFSLSVIAQKGVPFRGPVLLGAFANAGLVHGEMQIFHRHERPDGSGPIVFSVASIREPGYFDLSAIEGFTTDGLVLFFQLPGEVDPLRAFDVMIETARTLAGSLDATIFDAARSVLTNQTVGHMREEVIACELQQRLARQAS